MKKHKRLQHKGLANLLKYGKPKIGEQEKEDSFAVVKSEDVEFVTDSKAVVLTQTYRHANILLYIMFAFIVAAIIWASVTKLEEITIGAGRVIPSGKIKVIQNLEGGIVEGIYVKDGDMVKRDQILLKLDPLRFTSSFRDARWKYLTLLANVARLEAESQGQTRIHFPPLLKKEAPELVESETQFFKGREEDLETKIRNLNASYVLAQQELDIIKPLVKEKVMSNLELLRLEREVNDLKAQVIETKEAFKGKAHAELNEKKVELASAEEAMLSAEDKMKRTTIRSPVNGVIKTMNISTIGEVIKPADDIIEIVPVADNLTVEVDVNPADIAFIHPKAKALVKITAYDYAVYGGLPAEVDSISADTIRDDKGNHFYKVKVRTSRNYLDKDGKVLPIIPGMTATVNIITSKKSILNYILKPILRAKEAAFKER